jgi:hypothetical protein
MTDALLHDGAVVLCQHGGTAKPITVSPRVNVGGQALVLQNSNYTISGCNFVPSAGNGPCVMAQWLTAATRIKAGGVPILLSNSQAICTPTSTGLQIVNSQTRVKGQ